MNIWEFQRGGIRCCPITPWHPSSSQSALPLYIEFTNSFLTPPFTYQWTAKEHQAFEEILQHSGDQNKQKLKRNKDLYKTNSIEGEEKFKETEKDEIYIVVIIKVQRSRKRSEI